MVNCRVATFSPLGCSLESGSWTPLALAKSLKTRDEVRAEAVAGQASGEIAALAGEDSGSFRLAQMPQARDAGQVLAGSPTRSAQ